MSEGNTDLPLKATPSLLYQNLSYGENKFVYVHKNEVHTVNIATRVVTSIQVKDRVPIFQAKAVSILGKTFLVLAAQGGAQFWDLEKEKNIFSVSHIFEEGKESFLSRGITVVGSFVAVGLSTGGISIIEVKNDTGVLVNTLKEHVEVITDVSSGVVLGEMIMVSADLAGEIIVWDSCFKKNLKLCRDQSGNDTPTSLVLTPFHIVCGYGSGKIRLFNLQGTIAVEILAHSRWINSIDYSPNTNTLASVSEDMLVQFWKMPSENDQRVIQKGHRFLKDCLLTGVKFVNDGKRVGVAAYDTERIFICETPQ